MMLNQKKGYIVDKRTDVTQVICLKCHGFEFDVEVVDEVDGVAVGPYVTNTCIECGYIEVDHT
jgi:hypothetical protein